jgi:rhodanese-related sulfurtransferase
MKKINKKKLNELLVNGAILIDMRTPIDYRDNSIKGSKNLPLRNFINHLHKHDKKVPIALIVKSFEDDASDIKLVDTYAAQVKFEKIYVIEYSQIAG